MNEKTSFFLKNATGSSHLIYKVVTRYARINWNRVSLVLTGTGNKHKKNQFI